MLCFLVGIWKLAPKGPRPNCRMLRGSLALRHVVCMIHWCVDMPWHPQTKPQLWANSHTVLCTPWEGKGKGVNPTESLKWSPKGSWIAYYITYQKLLQLYWDQTVLTSLPFIPTSYVERMVMMSGQLKISIPPDPGL